MKSKRVWRGSVTDARSIWIAAMVQCAAGSAVVATSGTWTRLTHNAPAHINLMLLLPDGTVMAARNDAIGQYADWYRLTPDRFGSYVNGTWTKLASAHSSRLYFSSQVLPSGEVFVAGGEYGTGGPTAEIYDPLTNTWTEVDPPTSLLDPTLNSPVTGRFQSFSDSNSEILPGGQVLIAPVNPKVSGQPLIYDPALNTWEAGPTYFRGQYMDESAWVKLPDASILTLDPFGSYVYGNNPSERYIPARNAWVDDGVCPVNLYDPFGFELGAGFLLYNGRAFFLGSSGHTALYTPTGGTSPGTWVVGPDIPGSHGTPDAPAAMMVTGKILCAVSPLPTAQDHFPTPTTFYEYDPLTNSFTSVSAPVGASDPISCFQAAMLALPDGSILYSHMGTTVYTYTPNGSVVESARPHIQSIVQFHGSFYLTGQRLNGNWEGAAYGDDLQMATNYPLVRINHSNGNTYYARTFAWNSTGVATGNTLVGTFYKLPAGFPQGSYSLVVVANGIPSAPRYFWQAMPNTEPLQVVDAPLQGIHIPH